MPAALRCLILDQRTVRQNRSDIIAVANHPR
jgi:hypothetical protein